MPGQKVPQLFCILVVFVYLSCIYLFFLPSVNKWYLLWLAFFFCFFFAESKNICAILPVSHRDTSTLISKCDITMSSLWQYKLIPQRYHKLLIFGTSLVISSWYPWEIILLDTKTPLIENWIDTCVYIVSSSQAYKA